MRFLLLSVLIMIRTRKENESQEEQDRMQLVKNVDVKMKEIDSAGGRAM